MFVNDSRCKIDNFTVVVLVSLPLTEREAEVDLVLIQTSLVFLRKVRLKIVVSIRTT